MSAFQKQLMGKRQNKVNLKKKKLLAMMEDETVIDDPKVKLIGYKKLEVLHTLTHFGYCNNNHYN